MIYLIIVSVIWAFSFGFIKTNLMGIDPTLIAWARMVLALPLFLPFLRLKRLPITVAGRLFFIGSVQYGLMYITYLQAFRYLDAYQVVLFTIFTPLYVTLLNDIRTSRFRILNLGVAALAVLGAAVIQYRQTSWGGVLAGFFFMQLSNVCFAFGQIEYKRLRPQFADLADRQVYALLYLGAAVVTTLATTAVGGWESVRLLHVKQVGTLLYLGILASGLCFFWWNKGAVLTEAGTLAVFNNMKIPLGVFVSLIIFGESTNLPRLILGGGLMVFAVWLSQRRKTALSNFG